MYGWVSNYIGIPFASGGRDRSGLDCYGLVRLVLREQYGYDLPRLSGGYTNALDVAETKALFIKNVPLLCAQKIDAPEEKAVALLRMGGMLCHVGLYAGDGCIIHSRHRLGVVCERLTSPLITGSVEGWYRVDTSYSALKPVHAGTD